MSSALITTTASLTESLKIGMILDRKQTNRLLNEISKLETDSPGCATMQAQLRSMLAQRDWVKISITAPDSDYLKKWGVCLGVAEYKLNAKSARLSPLQKWQRNSGRDRR